jgi:hypothetical protein
VTFPQPMMPHRIVFIRISPSVFSVVNHQRSSP